MSKIPKILVFTTCAATNNVASVIEPAGEAALTSRAPAQAITQSDSWASLRQFTPARIAQGRAGTSLPTAAQLAFQLAHAQARDAVHRELDVAALRLELESELHAPDITTLGLYSTAPDRTSYLQRPDWGRKLSDASRTELLQRPSAACDIAFCVVDGLSALAVQRHAAPLLQAVLQRLMSDGAKPRWHLGPIVVVEQGRVAIGDEIGELLQARLVVVLIGERPGLSSPDSLGLYFTWAPRVGCTDAQRNCISNVRPEGLPYDEAAGRLVYLLGQAFARQLTGVALKDDSPAALQMFSSDVAS